MNNRRSLFLFSLAILFVGAWAFYYYIGWLGILISIIGLLVLISSFINWTFEQLRILNQNIDEILRVEDINKLCQEAVEDFVKVFGADYAVISKVNFKERRIISEEWFDLEKGGYPNKTLGDASPKEWIDKSNYSLDPQNDESKDILVEVLKLKEQVKVVDNKVLDAIIPDTAINPNISAVHRKYARVYFPIIQKNAAVSEDIPLGVVELGFKNRVVFELSLARTIRYVTLFANKYRKLRTLSLFLINISRIIDIELYLNVFARQYYSLLLKNLEKKSLDSLFNDQQLDTITEPQPYLTEALERIRTIIGGKYGFIAFRNAFNFDTEKSSSLPFNERTVFSGGITHHNVVPTIASGNYDKSITQHVFSDNKAYWSPNVKAPEEQYYVKGLDKDDVVSEIGIPLRQAGQPIGVLFLDSPQENYYNAIHADLLERMMRKIMPEYLRKKRNAAYRQLSEPSRVWETPEVLFKSISDLLHNYFESDYIAVWTRKSLTDKTFELCKEATSAKLFQIYKEQGLLETENKEAYQQNESLIRIESCQSEKPSRFTKICQEQGFQSYLLISVVIQKKYELFFNILSFSALSPDFIKRDQEFLEQISNKASVNLQGLKLIKSFSSIAKALSTPEDQSVQKGQALRQMLANALWVTNADIVSFFPYYGNDMMIEDVEEAGGVLVGNDDRGKPIAGKAKLANLIIEKGTQWFSNQAQYEKVLKGFNIKVPTIDEQKGFRRRNNIKSTAAIVIEHEGLKRGVIFFNFRNEIDFDEQINLKSLIIDFSTFLGIYLINRGLLLEIQTALQTMQAATIQLTTQKETVTRELARKQKELQDIETQLTNILPRATRTSFYQILEGINHQIKHSLFDIYISLRSIETHSTKLTEKEKEIIQKSIREVNNNIANVETLLKMFDFSNQGLEVLDMNELLERVVKFFKIDEYKTISFDLELQPNISILANKAEFTMIFYNLINNAVQALLDKRDISSDKSKFKGNVTIKTMLKNKSFVFSFEDNGTGIDNEVKGRIFERGFTTKKRGTGIGLYFVSEILENEYDGLIHYESVKGQGTKFIITIPEHINYR